MSLICHYEYTNFLGKKYVHLIFSSYKNYVRIDKSDLSTLKNCVGLLKQIPANDRTFDSSSKIWTVPEKCIEVLDILLEPSNVCNHVSLANWLSQPPPPPNFSNFGNPFRETGKVDWEELKSQAKAEKPEDFFNKQVPTTTYIDPLDIKSKFIALVKPILELSSGSDLTDFTRAYKLAARKFHPDLNGGNAEKMSELNFLWTAYKEVNK